MVYHLRFLLIIYSVRKNILYLFIIIFSFTPKAYSTEIKYIFLFKETNFYTHICINSSPAIQTQFILPRIISSNKDDHNKYINISINSKKLEQIKHSYDYLIIDNQVGDNVCIDYCLDYGDQITLINKLISPNTFYLHGFESFAIPDFNSNDKFDIQFQWEGNKNPIFSNINFIDDEFYRTKLTMQELENSFFISGFNESYLNKNMQSYILLTPKFKYLTFGLINHINKLKRIENIIFSNVDTLLKKEYFIFLPALNNLSEGEYKSGNDYSIFKINIKENQKLDKFLEYLISHEYFHKVLNMHTIPVENIKEDYWFFEGFTDYISMQSNLQANIWSVQDYIDIYNEKLKNYFQYEMDKVVLAETYLVPLYESTGYVRGLILAHNIENALKNGSNGKNLLNFLNELIDFYKANSNKIFNDKIFISKLELYSGINFSNELAEIKNLTSGIHLSKKILNNKFCLTYTKIKIPVYVNVNLFKLFKELNTSFLNSKGLKDGQKIIEINYFENKKDEFTIKTTDKNILLKPKYEIKNIPQYIECLK